jgi:hypothetical protein
MELLAKATIASAVRLRVRAVVTCCTRFLCDKSRGGEAIYATRLQPEVTTKNAEGRKGSTRWDEGFALRIVRMFSALPKTTEAQALGKHVFPAI